MTYRTLLKSKIHRAVVTSADPDYEGSLTVDSALLEAARMDEYKFVRVVDVENGARLETYLMAGPAGSGVVQSNGAAARLLYSGDHISMAFAQVPEPLEEKWDPVLVQVNEANQREAAR